ncbi:hypothetical protein, partial [Xanthomonas citri]|uniref:hypothetical protein n=1 Tax=Xanthomonas citri TaxID=346 RepID=UPI0020CABBB8
MRGHITVGVLVQQEDRAPVAGALGLDELDDLKPPSWAKRRRVGISCNASSIAGSLKGFSRHT